MNQQSSTIINSTFVQWVKTQGDHFLLPTERLLSHCLFTTVRCASVWAIHLAWLCYVVFVFVQVGLNRTLNHSCAQSPFDSFFACLKWDSSHSTMPNSACESQFFSLDSCRIFVINAEE